MKEEHCLNNIHCQYICAIVFFVFFSPLAVIKESRTIAHWCNACYEKSYFLIFKHYRSGTQLIIELFIIIVKVIVHLWLFHSSSLNMLKNCLNHSNQITQWKPTHKVTTVPFLPKLTFPITQCAHKQSNLSEIN